MYEIIEYNKQYNHLIYQEYQKFVREENFFYEESKSEFSKKLFENPLFQEEGTFIALKNQNVIGFISGLVRDIDINNPNGSGFVHTLFVNKNFRRQGVGSHLLEKVEQYFKSKNMKSSRWVFLSNINWVWNIPHYPGHIHPGAPCVRINTEHYFFLLHHGYVINSIHEGFHLPLSEYELNSEVIKRIEKNEVDGYLIEKYNSAKHYGLEEFCKKIETSNIGFANAIRSNLKKEKPNPFLVATHNGKVVGWTGAMYNESSGRGHFDGIIVDPDERKRGLGKILFCKLCYWSKNNGSKYMTLFTGLDNPARYIYFYAGFKIAQTFADMKKTL